VTRAAASSRRGLTGLLAALGVSILGSRMSFVALPWLVLVTTGSAGKMGLVAFAELAPYVVTQALGGPAVDRLGAWRVSVAGDLVAALAVGLVPVLHAGGMLSLGSLAALVAVAGVVRGAGDASRMVLLPGVTETTGVPVERATGLYDGVNRAAGMIGAPLAGLLIAATSAPAVVAIDAATFAASAVIVAALVPRAAQPVHAEATSGGVRGYLASLREGFGHLRGDRLLLGIGTMVLVTNLIDMATSGVMLPIWSREVTGGAVALGLLSGALGLGAVLGNVATAALGPRASRHRVYAVGFLVAGAPRLLLLAAVASLPPALAITFVTGLAIGGINPTLGAVEYERVPRHLQARVLGALNAVAWAGIPVGGLVGGVLVDAIGLRPALVAAGAVYGLATLAPFVFPAWRQMDDRPRLAQAQVEG
jgi:Major Facilitator Superfamily